MPLNLAPVNFGAMVQQNPLAQIGQALSALPQEQEQATLQKQVVGKQLMAPYLAMIKADYSKQNDPSVMRPLEFLSKQYGIPIPFMGQDDSAAPQASDTGAAQPLPQSGQPQQQATPPQPKAPPGPGAAMSIGGPAGQVPNEPTPAIPGVAPGAAASPGSPAYQSQQPPQRASTGQETAPMTSPITGAPIPGAPPVQQPPQRRIAPSFVGATLDPQTVLTLQQMQPDQRMAYLQATGVDPRWVPKSLMSAPVVMDPAQKVKVLDEINTQITKLQMGGNLSPSRLQELAKSYQASGLIDQTTADSITEDPETLSQMGRGLQVKLQLLLQSGAIKEQQYNLAVQRLGAYETGQASLADYRKFQEQFIGFKENYMTVSQQQTQERINNQTTEFARTADQRDQLLQQGNDRLSHSDFATLAQDTRSADANYSSLMATYAQMDATGKADITNAPKNPDGTPAGPSFAQTMADAKQLRDKLHQQMSAAHSGYRNPDPALRKQGVEIPGSKRPIPVGAVPGTLPNGKHGYQYNQKLYNDDGSNYTQ